MKVAKWPSAHSDSVQGCCNTRQTNGAADPSPKPKHITVQDSNTAVVEPSWKAGGILTSQRSSVFQTAKRLPHAVKGTDAIQNRTYGKCSLQQKPHWVERRTEHHGRAEYIFSCGVGMPGLICSGQGQNGRGEWDGISLCWKSSFFTLLTFDMRCVCGEGSGEDNQKI